MSTWARVAGAVKDNDAAEVVLELILPWKHLLVCSGITVTGIALLNAPDQDRHATGRLHREATVLIDGRGFRKLEAELQAITQTINEQPTHAN